MISTAASSVRQAALMADYEETQEIGDEPAAEADVGERRCCEKLPLLTTLAGSMQLACTHLL